MSFAPPIGPASPASTTDIGDWPAPPGLSGPEHVAFRQLRHQTKNALQRILCVVHDCADEARTPAMQALAEDLQRRICLSASISDALFGFTERPAGIEQRLRALGAGMLCQLAGASHCIDLTVIVDSPGAPPPAPEQDDIILRVAHEMVGNAIRHGLKARLIGQIEIRLSHIRGRIRLTVADDGWGLPHRDPGNGQGLQLMRDLSRGRVSLERVDDWTVATLELAAPARHSLMRLT